MAKNRLDKLLADSGLYSRSEARSLIRAGSVAVNGSVIRAPEERFDDTSDDICVNGQRICCNEKRCFMLYKPEGVLSATEDPRQQTVLDLLPEPLRRLGLFPVGRLDKDTTGLLLLTNDGDLAHRVISPKKHVPKVYEAQLDRALSEADALAFAEGLVLSDGTQCLPARLELPEPTRARVTVYEGKYHQVKRMFRTRGATVVKLHRAQIGALSLDPRLRPGEYRELCQEEIEQVFS